MVNILISYLSDLINSFSTSFNQIQEATVFSSQFQLERAAKDGDLATLQDFLKKEININFTSYNPLKAAVTHEQLAAAELLLSHNANPNLNLGNSLLTVATKNNDLPMVKLLLAHNIEVDTYNPHYHVIGNSQLKIALETSALFNAALNGKQEIVTTLLDAGVDSSLGLKPIHIAAIRGDSEALKALLTEGASCDETDSLGIKPIFYAAALNQAEAVDLLAEHGANVNEHFEVLEQANEVFQFPFQATTPLHVAAQNNATEAIESLIKQHAYINEYNADYKTPLYVAAQGRNDATVEILLKTGADPFVSYVFYDSSPAQYQEWIKANICAYKNQSFNTEHAYKFMPFYDHNHNALRSSNPDVEKFAKAVIEGDLTEVKLLISTVPASDYTSPRYLTEAILHNQTEVADYLLSKGAKVTTKESYWHDMLPLHAAAQQNNVSMIEKLLDAGANINATISYGSYTAIHLAAKKNHFEAVKLLVEKGASLTVESESYNSLNGALSTNNLELVNYMLDHGAKINAYALKNAVSEHEIDTVKLLVSKIEDINAYNKEPYPLLTLAVIHNKLDIAEYLLDIGINRTTYNSDYKESTLAYFNSEPPELSNTTKAYYTSALFNAILNNNQAMIALLLENEVDQNLGLTSLDLAIINNDPDAFYSLLAGNPQAALEADTLGINPLYYAAVTNQPEMINHLVKLGADVNEHILSEDGEGYTPAFPLMAATENGSFNAVAKLIELGAYIDETDSYGRTPLLNATEHLEVAELLVANGADIFHQSKFSNVFKWLENEPNYQNIKETILSKHCENKNLASVSLDDVISSDSAIAGIEEVTNAPIPYAAIAPFELHSPMNNLEWQAAGGTEYL